MKPPGAQDLRDVVICPDRDRLALGQLSGGERADVPPCCERFHDDVAVGQHPLQPVCFTADRQGYRHPGRHLAGRAREGLVLIDRSDQGAPTGPDMQSLAVVPRPLSGPGSSPVTKPSSEMKISAMMRVRFSTDKCQRPNSSLGLAAVQWSGALPDGIVIQQWAATAPRPRRGATV